MTSLLESFVSRGLDDRPGCTFRGRTTPWNGVVSESATRAEILRNFLDPARPQKFAVLVDDPCEYVFWMGAALMSGACMTGLDPRQRSSIDSSVLFASENQFVIVDEAGARHLDSLEFSEFRSLDLRSTLYLTTYDSVRASTATTPRGDTPKSGSSQLLCSLTIDSPGHGTTTFDATHELVTLAAHEIANLTEMTHYDICYDAMPMNCATSVLGCWGPAMITGAEIVLERDFTAEKFLDDVREFNCTYFVFTGSMISELLELPESALDGDHRLRVGLGTKTTPEQRIAFQQRFGCELIDAEKWRPYLLRNF